MVQLQILTVIWLWLRKRREDFLTEIVLNNIWEKFRWKIVDFSFGPARRRIKHLRKLDADRPNTTKNKHTCQKENYASLGQNQIKKVQARYLKNWNNFDLGL